MKRAVQLPQYSDTNEFTAPDGVEIVKIDKVSNLLSDADLPGQLRRRVPGRNRTDGALRSPRRQTQYSAKNLRAREKRERNSVRIHPSTSEPSGIGWQRGHQKVTRASGP